MAQQNPIRFILFVFTTVMFTSTCTGDVILVISEGQSSFALNASTLSEYIRGFIQQSKTTLLPPNLSASVVTPENVLSQGSTLSTQQPVLILVHLPTSSIVNEVIHSCYERFPSTPIFRLVYGDANDTVRSVSQQPTEWFLFAPTTPWEHYASMLSSRGIQTIEANEKECLPYLTNVFGPMVFRNASNDDDQTSRDLPALFCGTKSSCPHSLNVDRLRAYAYQECNHELSLSLRPLQLWSNVTIVDTLSRASLWMALGVVFSPELMKPISSYNPISRTISLTTVLVQGDGNNVHVIAPRKYVVGSGEFSKLRFPAVLAVDYPSKQTSDVGIIIVAITVAIGGSVFLCVLIIFLRAISRNNRDTESTNPLNLSTNSNKHANAPQGPLVSLLFTDIECSTELWSAYPQHMGDVIEQHHSIMRQCISKCGAYEVKTIGDSFMIAVDDPVTATGLAVMIQKRLEGANWPSLINEYYQNIPGKNLKFNGIHVRIGIHTGVVQAQVDVTTERMDYYGPTVNLCARIESAACGGQILCTKAHVNACVSSQNTPMAEFVILGNFFLKGMTDGVEVCQVNSPELPSRNEFPPLRAATTPQAGLDTLNSVGAVSPRSPTNNHLGATEMTMVESMICGPISPEHRGGRRRTLQTHSSVSTMSSAGTSLHSLHAPPSFLKNQIAFHPLVMVQGYNPQDVLDHVHHGYLWLYFALSPLKKPQREAVVHQVSSAWKVCTNNYEHDMMSIALRAADATFKLMVEIGSRNSFQLTNNHPTPGVSFTVNGSSYTMMIPPQELEVMPTHQAPPPQLPSPPPGIGGTVEFLCVSPQSQMPTMALLPPINPMETHSNADSEADFMQPHEM